jgi:hypothetical protein
LRWEMIKFWKWIVFASARIRNRVSDRVGNVHTALGWAIKKRRRMNQDFCNSWIVLMKTRCDNPDCKSGIKFLSEFTWYPIVQLIHQSVRLTVKFPSFHAWAPGRWCNLWQSFQASTAHPTDPNRFPHTITVPQSKDAMMSHLGRLDGFWITIIFWQKPNVLIPGLMPSMLSPADWHRFAVFALNSAALQVFSLLSHFHRISFPRRFFVRRNRLEP